MMRSSKFVADSIECRINLARDLAPSHFRLQGFRFVRVAEIGFIEFLPKKI